MVDTDASEGQVAMMRREFRDWVLGPRLTIVRILWVVMMASVVAYVVVALILGSTGVVPLVSVPEIVQAVLSAVAVLIGGASLWWRSRWLTPEALIAASHSSGGVASDPMPAGMTAETPQESEALRVVIRFQTALVVCWVLSVAVAVIGFVVFVLTGNMIRLVILAAVALALLLVGHRPSAERLEGALRAIEVGRRPVS